MLCSSAPRFVDAFVVGVVTAAALRCCCMSHSGSIKLVNICWHGLKAVSYSPIVPIQVQIKYTQLSETTRRIYIACETLECLYVVQWNVVVYARPLDYFVSPMCVCCEYGDIHNTNPALCSILMSIQHHTIAYSFLLYFLCIIRVLLIFCRILGLAL